MTVVEPVVQPTVQPGFVVHYRTTTDPRWVSLVGEIDMAAENDLALAFMALMNERPADTVVDLSSASLLNATAMSFLCNLHLYVSTGGFRMTISRPHPSAVRSLTAAGLDMILR